MDRAATLQARTGKMRRDEEKSKRMSSGTGGVHMRRGGCLKTSLTGAAGHGGSKELGYWKI
eukprot:5942211-Pyramimonas_sp.AAC.1